MLTAPRLIELPTSQHKLGNLAFINGSDVIPFEIRRVYFVYDIPRDAKRGGHAHRSNDELIVAVSGSFIVELEEPNGTCSRYHLTKPNQGLLVPANKWRRLHSYAARSVCLVLASETYDPAEYIRDYELFRSMAG